MKQLINSYLNRYATLTVTEIDLFYSQLVSRTYKKKEHILNEGDVCENYYFIVSGLVRTYILDEALKENITSFAIERWWVTNLESFVQRSPSAYFMECVEDTTVLSISRASLYQMYSQIPTLERVFRIITENMFIAKQRKYDIFEKKSGLHQYTHFLKELSMFAKRIPNYMIASYLNMTPEYLSAIKKQLKS